ncbi:MAG: hypothetical protein U1E29_04440 [Coriobacteriia bacterium]|nr:hypothetical protein [Coriobacteriia bacterium]
MESMTASEVTQRVAWATATDLDTGEVQQLVAQGRCHFLERFEVGPFEVQLRLDWGDIDGNGFPRLDADFYCRGARELDRSMRGHESHHTDSVDDALHIYVWRYEDERRHLRIDLAWRAEAHGRSVSYGTAAGYAVEPSADPA